MPYYSSNYALPGSLYMPSAVPLRYYTRSAPVRVISSPLRDYSPPRIFSVNVRPSVIHRELMRIEHKSRPRYGYDPTEEYLNSPSARVGIFDFIFCIFLCYVSFFFIETILFHVVM